MLNLVTGTPGSGKSLTMAGKIRAWLKRKRLVVCNFDIAHDTKNYRSNFLLIENDKLSPDKLREVSERWFSRHRYAEDSILLVIDEAQIMFSARTWNAKDRNDWLYFFSQSRKYGFDVYLLTQIDTSIDKNLRLLVENQYICRKFNNSGWVGRFIGLFVFGHPLICRVKYWYPLKQRLSCDWFLGTKRSYSLYDTNKRFTAKP